MNKKILIFIVMILLLSFNSFALNNRDSDLMGLWFLDESSGNLLDTKDNGKDFTLDMFYPLSLYLQSPLASFSTNSVGFDGTQNSASTIISTADAFNSTTIFFNKTTGFTVNAHTDLSAIGDRGVVGSQSGTRGWQMRHSSDPNVFCRWFDFSSTGHIASVSGAFFNTMVTCVFNQTGAFIYLNGTLRASVSDTTGILQADANFSIGSSGEQFGVFNTPFNGDIDEVSLWNRTLTPTEILSLFTVGVEIVLDEMINSSWNVTAGSFENANTLAWNTGGTVNFSSDIAEDVALTLNVNTSLFSNMTCSTTENNHTGMIIADPLSKSATTNTTLHSYTLSDNFTSEGAGCVYCSFIRSDGTETSGGVSDSGCLNVFINTKPINNSFPNPPSFSTVSGVVNINWDAYTDINLAVYELLLIESVESNISVNTSAFYRFEEGNGTLAINSVVGSNNNGTISGATYTASKGDKNTGTFALDFDGFNDFVNLTNQFGFDSDDSFSFGGWFQTVNGGTILSKMESSGNFRGYLFFMQSGKLFISLNDITVTNTLQESSTATFDDGAWHHTVVTYDGTGDPTGLKLYVDGSEVSTDIVFDSLTGTLINTKELFIGTLGNSVLFFDGNLDEIGFIEREITGAQVNSLFNNGFTNGTSFNTTFIGNTTPAITELDFNFSNVAINKNYTVVVRGHDDYGLFTPVFNQFVFNELFVPPPPAGFFNITLIPFVGEFFDSDNPFQFSFNISGTGMINFTGGCNLTLNGTFKSTFSNESLGINVFSNITVPIGNSSWNVSCQSGNDPFNSPQFLLVQPDPPFIPINVSNVILNINSCPDTLPEVILYMFFVLIFFGLYILGFFILRLISFFASIILILIAVASFSCIGALSSVFLTAICCFLLIFSMWGFDDTR